MKTKAVSLGSSSKSALILRKLLVFWEDVGRGEQKEEADEANRAIVRDTDTDTALANIMQKNVEISKTGGRTFVAVADWLIMEPR